MESRIKKYIFPAVVVLAAALQSMASVRGPFSAYARTDSEAAPDTVIYDNSRIFTKFRKDRIADTGDSLSDGFSDAEAMISARDTLKAPDSLRYTDPFRFRYYVALNDSLTHVLTRDSLLAAGDTLTVGRLDSVYFADSAKRADAAFLAWYSSLDKAARKQYDFNKKQERKQHLADSILDAKDSIRAVRDSIAEARPRILETFALPDSMQYKRIVKWHSDRLFNTLNTQKVDTSYNYWFNDLPFMREETGATYLGVSGSPVQYYDFTRRKAEEGVSFYAPYEPYSFSPGTAPMYNTKTAYTELAYWGTLFANKEQEEDNLHILTTQNFYPQLNLTLSYDRNGAGGMLENETVDNRTVFAGVNWLGKRHTAHLGYIFNSIKKAENGGISDNSLIRDTTIGPREVPVRLTDADNLLKKNTIYLNQTLRIPFSFLKKKKSAADSIAAAGGLIDKDVTTAFIGHNSEYSTYRKIYTDKISESDTEAREYYGDRFYIDPVQSEDSIRVMKLENKVFIKLQPWASDAVVSSVNAGLGNRIMNYYMASPAEDQTPAKNHVENSTYLYGGAAGQVKKYVGWNATGSYTLVGARAGDFNVEADARFSVYPFRRHRKSPLSVSGHFETSLTSPEYFENHYFSNHLKWDSDFSKTSRTTVSGAIEVPHWNLGLTAAYTLMSNYIYYDELAVAAQNSDAMNVLKLGINKDFRLWNFHFDNRALFQFSSDDDVLPLPAAALNLRWYLQFNIVKDVMQMQLGANGLYTTSWYAPAYNPELGMFHNQKNEKYGDCPYIDLFVNVQWKRATIFVKLVNANMGWPNNSADYFSADGYIRPQRSLKFGVWWPFYLQTRKNGTVSAGGSLGGSPSSASGRQSGGSSSRSGSGGLSGLSGRM